MVERVVEEGLVEERIGGPYINWEGEQLLPESVQQLGNGRTYRAGGSEFTVTGPGARVAYGEEPQTPKFNRYPVQFGQGRFARQGTVEVRDGYASDVVEYERHSLFGPRGSSTGLGPVERRVRLP